MIEKRIIDGKSYFVNVIENEDGSITEQYLDDYLDSLMKQKDIKTKEMLEKEREKLRLERIEFAKEKIEWKKMQEDANNNIDIKVSDPNYLKICSEEEREAYNYLAKNNMRTTKKDLKSLLRTSRWKSNIYPSIKDEREKERRKIENEKLEKQKRKKQIAYSLLILGIILTFILCYIGASYDIV